MTILPLRGVAAQVVALSILTWATAAAQSTDAASMIARIEAAQVPNRQGFDGFTLTELMQRFRVPGVSIAVIKDGRIHWAKGYGVADVATGRLVDTGTVFQAASISKPVFAMTVAKLAQDGRISLDADVNTLLKTWKVPDSEHTRDQKVTLRSLMSHTSGASDGFGFPGYNPDEPRPTLVQIITGEKPSNVGVVRFTRAPYVGFQYSGGGVTLAQLAVTDAIGRPLADLADELLLKPLGLTRSSFEQPITDRLSANAAFAHNPGGRRSGPASWHVYPEQAAAGLWTTPRIGNSMAPSFTVSPTLTLNWSSSAGSSTTPGSACMRDHASAGAVCTLP